MALNGEKNKGKEKEMEKERVLIIDDDKSILTLLKHKLTQEGFEVAAAAEVRDFWNLAFDWNPDLIILDIWLEGKLGTDLYHDLLNFGLDRDLPVIFITALLESRSPSYYYGNGEKFALYSKPFDFARLLADIKRLTHIYKTKSLAAHKKSMAAATAAKTAEAFYEVPLPSSPV